MSFSFPCDPPRRVTVVAPARLHLGFMDPDASLGRRFGSIGVTLEGVATRIQFIRAERLVVEGVGGARAGRCAARFLEALQLPGSAHLVIDQAIPEHVGLGSGTQMDLAVGMGLARLFGLNPSLEDIVMFSGRGARSGIGIAAFREGGFIVDGGRGSNTRIPPTLARLPFPADWRLILVFDARGQGLHGAEERAAFRNLAPFRAEDAAHLCHLLLMRALPALAENDIGIFGAAIGELQRAVGDHFAPAQGGRFTSPAVAEALAWLEKHGAAGVGQSSWGPTGFGLLATPQRAEKLLREIRAAFADHPALHFQAVACRNSGATVECDPA
ncbi:MAG TPA: beta-ribofuranosylaminobenzene 5'-phosphate synthase family protein [Methylococcaceae bacterium]|nr:beta-ribofuranosylaminobenzene 5'-phosphate synthase family protein [Methylococcaceae bacterium]